MRYSIEGQELIDIADALRRRHGETKLEVQLVDEVIPDVVVIKTPNASGYGSYSGTVSETCVQTVKKNGANKIVIDLGYSCNGLHPLYIITGEYNAENFPINDASKYNTGGMKKRETFTFENTDSVTLYYDCNNGNGTGYFYGECLLYDADGNKMGSQTIQVEKEVEVLNTYSSDEMAQAIDDIDTGVILPEEAFIVSGNCTYKFSYNAWNWYVNEFKDRITSKDITNAERMFSNNTGITEIPFKLNFDDETLMNLSSMFSGMYITKAPIVNMPNPIKSNLNNLFQGCSKIKDLNGVFENEEEWGAKWQSFINTAEFGQHYLGALFSSCGSLRTVPTWFYQFRLNPESTYYIYASYSIYYRPFYDCRVLDEALNIPVWKCTVPQTKPMFDGVVQVCSRLKDFTFETNEDSTPVVTEWKSQVLDMTSNVGWASNSGAITLYGITADKEVKDDATYQALKDDPDWFTTKVEYSRYNHDSAVRTINSLPDTSAYLATAGGTNTIKFKKAAGSKTDGGAISTLTDAEIAVAAAKGWTVTLV